MAVQGLMTVRLANGYVVINNITYVDEGGHGDKKQHKLHFIGGGVLEVSEAEFIPITRCMAMLEGK